MIDSLSAILGSIRIQDVFDMLVIWIMLSALLIWFKERASRFVFVGIALLGAVYIAARYFQLYLTTVVLQGFFAIFLFVLVVIFQEDLRRFFERLALWGRFPRTFFDERPAPPDAETIARTAANLARQLIGALIVLKGHDPLDRHLNGGTPLNGVLSQPLLESLFDPHSAGHDGAVVIEGNRVAQFGCHLPLSANSGRFGSPGLRHTAALGLSERCDALSVVVSEERGTISIARHEQLREVAGEAALRVELESFYAEMAPKTEGRPVVRWLRENSREKIVALALACLLWVTFGYQKESVRRDFTVPVEYANISTDWVIEDPKVTAVKIVLMGPPQAFQLLNPDALRVSLDLSKVREGLNEIPVSREMVKRPSNLAVAGITPSRIGITVSRLTAVSLPVVVATEGRLPAGLSVQKITVSPATVRVLIPGRLRENGLRVQTEPVDLKKVQSSSSLQARLVAPPEARFAGGKAPAATVTIRLKKSARTGGRP